MKTVLFVNWTDQPFSGVPYLWKNKEGQEETIVDENCKWGGITDTFAPHSSRYMEDWRAMHFAKHLITRELNKLDKPIDDVKLQKEMLQKCILEKGGDVVSQNIDMELMNLKAPASGPSSHILEDKTENIIDPDYEEFLKFKAMKAQTDLPRTLAEKEIKKKGRPKKEVPEKEFADLEKINA